jgi:spore coat polysaccharide biosynthesis protein SpsF
VTAAIIVEARMGSRRLPGKHMRPLLGKPMVVRMLERLMRSKKADVICLATTERPEDEVLEHWALDLGLACYRGSVDDVLGRVLAAARSVGADVIAEITGDCPLADAALIDQAIDRHSVGDADYVANILDRLTYPVGFDVQVYPTDLLAEVDRLCSDPDQRVDVTPYIYGHGETFRLVNLDAPEALRRPAYRLCVDYPEDFAVIEQVFRALYPSNPTFGVVDIIGFLDQQQALATSNLFMPNALACPSSAGHALHETAPGSGMDTRQAS